MQGAEKKPADSPLIQAKKPKQGDAGSSSANQSNPFTTFIQKQASDQNPFEEAQKNTEAKDAINSFETASDLVQKKEQKNPFQAFPSPEDFAKPESYVSPLQAKLAIGQPNDKYEQEADRMAEQVLSNSSSIQRKCNPYPKNAKVQRKGLFSQISPLGTSKAQQKCAACEGEEHLQGKLIQMSGGQARASTQLESQINRQKGSGQSLDKPTLQEMNHSFGADFSGVKIHTDSSSIQMNQELGAKAFTVGNDIHFNQGAYNPGSQEGKKLLAHELTHTVQQGASTALQMTQEDFFMVTVHGQPAPIMNSAGPDDPMITNHVELDNVIEFRVGSELQLLGTTGDYIQVRGEAYNPDGSAYGNVSGWILKSNTNLTPDSNASVENDKAAQDLDDFLDEYLIPSLSNWRAALRRQGNAYLTAYTNYKDTLELASQQAQDRANFYAAVLTVVCVGPLGFFGDMAAAGRNVSSLLKNEAIRGSIEDAIQTGIGEGIDILQGGWFTRHISRETHPLRYLNSMLEKLDSLEGELTQHVGSTKSRIRRAEAAVNRANLNVQLFRWWADAKARNQPDTQTSEQALAREFERNFWIKYFLTEMSESVYYVFWGPGYEYENPEDAVKDRLRDVGLLRDAGIREWDSWPYQGMRPDYHPSPYNENNQVPYFGSDTTAEFVQYARTYEPRTFE